MKITMSILVSIAVIISVLYASLGGDILLIMLAATIVIVLVIGTFTLGVWYAHKSIQLGARLAIEAQNNNDKWDNAKMQSLASFGEKMLTLKQGNNEALPLLESSEPSFNGFIINGIEE